MNGVERFFRRYVFSTLGLLALLFAANVAVLAGLLLVGEMTVPTAFSITAFCDKPDRERRGLEGECGGPADAG